MVTILLTINRPGRGRSPRTAASSFTKMLYSTKPAPRRGVGFSTANTFENLLICSLRSLPTILAPPILP